jgi:hypothetical protein
MYECAFFHYSIKKKQKMLQCGRQTLGLTTVKVTNQHTAGRITGRNGRWVHIQCDQDKNELLSKTPWAVDVNNQDLYLRVNKWATDVNNMDSIWIQGDILPRRKIEDIVGTLIYLNRPGVLDVNIIKETTSGVLPTKVNLNKTIATSTTKCGLKVASASYSKHTASKRIKNIIKSKAKTDKNKKRKAEPVDDTQSTSDPKRSKCNAEVAFKTFQFTNHN